MIVGFHVYYLLWLGEVYDSNEMYYIMCFDFLNVYRGSRMSVVSLW